MPKQGSRHCLGTLPLQKLGTVQQTGSSVTSVETVSRFPDERRRAAAAPTQLHLILSSAQYIDGPHMAHCCCLQTDTTRGPPVEDLDPPVEDLDPPAEDLDPPVEDLDPPVEDLDPPAEDLDPPAEDLDPPAEDLDPPAEDLDPPVEDMDPPVEDLDPPSKPPVEVLASRPSEEDRTPPPPPRTSSVPGPPQEPPTHAAARPAARGRALRTAGLPGARLHPCSGLPAP
ncbi:zinc finger protein 358-like isoform X1 [Amphiprion ocellaris]|uniref:zinc finger protein 358-like isoform X1 n=2 Tax=Amphiprion ocellaris TaxID=80972 RepID=UPI002410E967|nr:zinc finger protein 358-like isoform X1 [Amphiprion ocellaris]